MTSPPEIRDVDLRRALREYQRASEALWQGGDEHTPAPENASVFLDIYLPAARSGEDL